MRQTCPLCALTSEAAGAPAGTHSRAEIKRCRSLRDADDTSQSESASCSAARVRQFGRPSPLTTLSD